jgi:hypothetical protein
MDSHDETSRVHGRKSSFSTANGDCATIDLQDDRVLIWDSKHPGGPVLEFTPSEYVAFWKGVLNREFDPPQDWVEQFDADRNAALSAS